MSNLIKANYIYVDRKDKKIIDSNKRIEKFILKPIEKLSVPGSVEQEFIEGIHVADIEKLVIQHDDLIEENVNSILEEANQKAQQIVNQAEIESEIIKTSAFEDAKNQGYQKGYEAAILDVSVLKEKLEQDIGIQSKEHEDAMLALEPKFANIMIAMIESITNIVVQDKKDVILHLIHRALQNTDNSNDFLIKVSKDDYVFINAHKNKIIESLKEDVFIQIIEDASLAKNECMIETETSIIDCGLGVQLENLITNLKLLTNV